MRYHGANYRATARTFLTTRRTTRANQFRNPIIFSFFFLSRVTGIRNDRRRITDRDTYPRNLVFFSFPPSVTSLLFFFLILSVNFSWRRFSFKFESHSCYTVVPHGALLNFEDLPSLLVHNRAPPSALHSYQWVPSPTSDGFFYPSRLSSTHPSKREGERERETEWESKSERRERDRGRRDRDQKE